MSSARNRPPRRVVLGAVVLLLGCLAVAAPFVAGKGAPFVLGVLILGSGLLEIAHAFGVRERRTGNAGFLHGLVSVVAGALLLLQPELALGGIAGLLGLSFVIGGVGTILSVVRGRAGRGWATLTSDGLLNVLLGLLIALQWPVPGILTIGVYVGLRILASGWSMIFVPADAPAALPADDPALHPDGGLGLPPNPEVARLRQAVAEEEESGGRIDRYWRATFLLTFFAIHVGRMDADWDFVGLVSPAVAVAGDVAYALVLTWALVTPLRLGWRWLTRPLERLAWRRVLARADSGEAPGLLGGPVRWWLKSRLRFAVQLGESRRSPTTALGRGLHVGLPLTAVLIALNPIWGFSWYFNTENWATEVWAHWAEARTDTWREEMARAVRDGYAGKGVAGDDLFRVDPEGVSGGDFSFLVIGDPGEGDPSQHILRDQYLQLGERPEVKFLVVASDVIYPAGDMKDYEGKFYLPYKGFTKPVYAMPGNHDWYDALEGFNANFLEPDAARAALRARRAVDKGLTSTTEARIEVLIKEAARLRNAYGVRTGLQRAPYFDVSADRFALIVADTGIARSMDDDQLHWLDGALRRARGKFKMVILGHPLYAAGAYQAEGDEPFAAVHRLLREHEVEVVMAGDYHSLEFYREPYQAGGNDRAMHHFVNGGGGAYLSIGTPLAWPRRVPVTDCAFYPRTDALTRKFDEQTPLWKKPVWIWVKRAGAWPSSPEGLASAFDFNRAPFFQSFYEVRVEPSANVVRLLPYGADGRLRWGDLQTHGRVIPDGVPAGPDDSAEFRFPLAEPP
jgi:uncharacterized membrane protein HdeD (DUF308 family)